MLTSKRKAMGALALAGLFALAACRGAEARPADVAQPSSARWIGAWGAAPGDAAGSFSNQTLRLNLTPLHAGDAARVRLSNRYGTQAITFDRVFLGKQKSGTTLVAGSNRRVRFTGRNEVVVPAGEEIVSDRVRIAFESFEHLAVSIYIAGSTGPATRLWQPMQRSFATVPETGDHSADETGAAFATEITEEIFNSPSRPFVTGIDVLTSKNDGVVVTIGDSLTDGAQRAPDGSLGGINQDVRYPDFLARRLHERRDGPGFSVINAGIGGNRILADGLFPAAGPSLLRRIEPDVLARSDVTDVILFEGINDVSFSPSVSPTDLFEGLRDAVRQLRTPRQSCPRTLNVLIATVPPASGSQQAGSAEQAAKLHQLNDLIRTHDLGAGVVDFERALRDPNDPDRLAPEYDSGDHLHPSSAGYQRMAREIKLARLHGRRSC